MEKEIKNKEDICITRMKIAKKICNDDDDISIEQMHYDLSASSDLSFSEAVLSIFKHRKRIK